VLLEEFKRVAILVEITGGEALVSRVEGGEELLALDNLKDVLPLTLSGVNTGGVVSAHVEHHHGVVSGVLEILLHALEVETLGSRVIVSVVLPLVADKIGDGSMNGPGRVGDKEIDILVGVPLAEEGEAEAKGTSSRDGLRASDSVLSERTAVSTIGKLEALLDVGVDTLDGGVLVVHSALQDDLFGTLNARKDKRLAVIVSVGTHAQEDLLGVFILLESVVQAEDGVCGGGSEGTPVGESGSALADQLTVCTLDEASEHLD
jgi:hypothetical protein